MVLFLSLSHQFSFFFVIISFFSVSLTLFLSLYFIVRVFFLSFFSFVFVCFCLPPSSRNEKKHLLFSSYSFKKQKTVFSQTCFHKFFSCFLISLSVVSRICQLTTSLWYIFWQEYFANFYVNTKLVVSKSGHRFEPILHTTKVSAVFVCRTAKDYF